MNKIFTPLVIIVIVILGVLYWQLKLVKKDAILTKGKVKKEIAIANRYLLN